MTKVNYQLPKEDNWYKWQGQKPPERIPHMTDDERTELMESNLAKHKCDFYQNGAFLVCDAGEFEHGKKIPTGKLYAGQNKRGTPQFRDYGPILRDIA